MATTQPQEQLVIEPLGGTLGFLAEEDNIFLDIKSLREAIFPKVAPTAPYKLRLKPATLTKPVFRAEVLTLRGWEISPTAVYKVQANRGHTKQVLFWRGFMARNLSKAVTTDERSLQMGQFSNTEQFSVSYQTTLSHLDLGAIFNDRAPDPQMTGAAGFLDGISQNIDPEAPTRLTVEKRDMVRNLQAIVELRVMRDKSRTEAEQELASIDPDAVSEEKRVAVDALRKIAAEAQAKYSNRLNRETRLQIDAVRKRYFDKHPLRQLTGERPTVPTLSTRVKASKENKQAPAATSTFIDPQADLIEILYNYATLDLHQELIASINALRGLPERKFHPCYPGESLTIEGNCPICEHTSRTIHAPIGEHIHDCTGRDLRRQVQQKLQNDFTTNPVQCEWKGCPKKTRFTDRDQFLAHVLQHLKMTEKCLWRTSSDSICGEVNSHDWHRHFGQFHDVNLYPTVDVVYCVMFVDEVGDGDMWDHHCTQHYAEIAQAYEVRAVGEVDLTPVGVFFVNGCVEFDFGSSFDGSQPDLHGHIQRGVAMAPMLCPFCLFDSTLEMTERMVQWIKLPHFKSHLEGHLGEDDVICPVPACGSKVFTEFDLVMHLVAFHRLPLCGSTNHTVARRLRLPVAPSDSPTPVVDLTHSVVDLAHSDDSMDVSPKRKEKKRVHMGSPSTPAPAPALAPAAAPAAPASKIWAHCVGCRMGKKDIVEHLLNVPQSSKCRARSRYDIINSNGKRTGVFVDYQLLPGANPDGNKQAKTGRDHYKDKFRVRDPLAKSATFGPIQHYAVWILTAPPLNVEGIAEQARPKNKGVRSAPKNQRCEGCKGEFVDVTIHYRQLKKTSPVGCQKHRFSERTTTGWGPAMDYATRATNNAPAPPAQPVASTSKLP
ncbi:hypothetical protein B0H16DRAFT_1689428 [Mycena metata]|uniref:C2H2-type domain-containing protein n=1 Tax=Mycena metata TaxID=1033252 RepID=A0AAD7J6E3_9AGAR|nr:hypothetical protein B0H16DRAFT_1689428 [Mycena metata]